MRMKYLIGATCDKEIAFMELELREDRMFSASFDVVRPMVNSADDYDLEDWVGEVYSRGCMGDCAFLDLLESYDCSPSELPSCIIDEQGDDLRDYLDCSLYPEEYYINDKPYIFESGSCGQHDVSNEMEIYVDEALVKKAIQFWKDYHLDYLDDTKCEEVEKLINDLDNVEVDEEDWICDYIKNNIE